MGYFDSFESNHLKAAAVEAADAFTEGSRNNRHDDDRVTVLRDGAPEWVVDAVREAHQGAFACDWIYQTLAGCAQDIEDTAESGDDFEESALQYADSSVTYYWYVAAWYRFAANASQYAENFDLERAGNQGGIADALAGACAEHIRDLYDSMLAAVAERATALAEEEDRNAEAATLDALAQENNAREESEHAALESAEARAEADANSAAFVADPHRGEPRGGAK
jgi:hypothetical protein